jgi:hypothetical protein
MLGIGSTCTAVLDNQICFNKEICKNVANSLLLTDSNDQNVNIQKYADLTDILILAGPLSKAE